MMMTRKKERRSFSRVKEVQTAYKDEDFSSVSSFVKISPGNDERNVALNDNLAFNNFLHVLNFLSPLFHSVRTNRNI